MNNERLLSIAKERYELEFNRIRHLVNIAGIYLAGLNVLFFLTFNVYAHVPIGLGDIHRLILLIILSVCSRMVIGLCILYLLFYIFTALLFFFMCLIVMYLFIFFLGQKYRFVPLPSKIQSYVHELQSYFNQNYEEFFKTKGSKNSLIDDRLSEKLLEAYIVCVEHNHRKNNLRTDKIYKIGYYLLISIIILVLNFILYSLLKSLFSLSFM